MRPRLSLSPSSPWISRRSTCLKLSRSPIVWTFLFLMVLLNNYDPLVSMDPSQLYPIEPSTPSTNSDRDDIHNNNNIMVLNDIQKTSAPAAASSSSQTFHNKTSDLIETGCYNPAVNLLKVATPEEQHAPGKPVPKILCFILTHEANHDTRVRTILDTWARKCDKFVVASTVDDPSINAIDMKAKPGYWQIWDKVQKAVIYLHETYRDDGYDWILKADDDTYVIMENLKSFLANEAVHHVGEGTQTRDGTNHNDETVPLIFGRIMNVPTLKTLKDPWGWFNGKVNKEFGKKLYQLFDPEMNMPYAHGGPGYIMNWRYVDILVDVVQGPTTRFVRGKVGEDSAGAVSMLYRNKIQPHSTRDPTTGLERSHPDTPETMYENPEWLKTAQEHIDNLGNGTKCCSPNSISYHHLTPEHMRLLEYQIYDCPKVLHSQGLFRKISP